MYSQEAYEQELYWMQVEAAHLRSERREEKTITSPAQGSGSLEMGHFNQQTGAELIKKAAAEFPAEFGLRGFPGKRFRFSEAASFITYNGDDFDHPVVMLYSQIFNEEESSWLDFAKGTPAELRREVVSL